MLSYLLKGREEGKKEIVYCLDFFVEVFFLCVTIIVTVVVLNLFCSYFAITIFKNKI